MKSSSRTFYLLLKLISITVLPVLLEAQKIEVQAEVTGFLGHDVILPCDLIQESNRNNVSQVQWDFWQPGGNKTRILVFDTQHGLHINESPLKRRVNISKYSLVITNVTPMDNMSYICKITAFPSGTFEGTTKLIVKEKETREAHALSAETISAIVTASLLLIMILAAICYFIFIRRSGSASRFQVLIDTSRRGTSVIRPSFIKEPDVVYSYVKPKQSRDQDPSSSEKHEPTVQVDDVTYSEVKILYRSL